MKNWQSEVGGRLLTQIQLRNLSSSANFSVFQTLLVHLSLLSLEGWPPDSVPKGKVDMVKVGQCLMVCRRGSLLSLHPVLPLRCFFLLVWRCCSLTPSPLLLHHSKLYSLGWSQLGLTPLEVPPPPSSNLIVPVYTGSADLLRSVCNSQLISKWQSDV